MTSRCLIFYALAPLTAVALMGACPPANIDHGPLSACKASQCTFTLSAVAPTSPPPPAHYSPNDPPALPIGVPFTVSPPMQGPLVTGPVWTRLPPPESLESPYPTHLTRLKTEARAVIDCSIKPDGQIAFCRVISEAPANLGVGEKALQLSRNFRMDVAKSPGAGEPDAHVLVTTRFVPASA